ncbi:hypothetical protein AMS68_005796 [Peltaster fructicola]|uniref:Zinc/iron permease n=1 Tax=Peltaster fructicola TaxID=286661 RepID=A0A6H0Y088_9PEZI|nr:hypothetical protein AMS68_005796 [Peltaster fructicola]
MWDGLIVLVLLCIVMAGASFLVGSLPLTLTLSPRALKLLTALGTGVLVGTALIVIIPEGVETLYNAEGSSHRHDKRALSARDDPFIWTTISAPHVARDVSSTREETYNILPVGSGVPSEGDFGQHDVKHSSLKTADDLDEYIYKKEDDDKDDDDDHNPHAYVGISIILGFVLMYLIDELPKHITPPSQPRRFQINLTSLSFNRTPTGTGDGAEGAAETHDEGKASSTTVGLVIHAAADGIALGASSTSKNSLSFIIFIALMVHKAPAAFGLTSVLLKQGVSKRAAKTHLIIFSLAAPVGALLTWTAAHLLGFGSMDSANTEFITGLLLLFSGGTFLYVAMHTMQDNPHDQENGHTNGFAEPTMGIYESPQNSKAANSEGLTNVGVTVLGMLLPLLTQFGHAH